MVLDFALVMLKEGEKARVAELLVLEARVE